MARSLVQDGACPPLIGVQSPLLAVVYLCGVLQRGLVLFVLCRCFNERRSTGGSAMAVASTSADPTEKEGSRGLVVFSFLIRGISVILGTAVLLVVSGVILN